MTTLLKWQRTSNYAGQDFSEYYVVVGQHRDSPILDKSNFPMALQRLGGESDTVTIEHAGHWAVGWIENILVHESDTDAVTEAQSIVDDLAFYPVLDDEDYSQREHDATEKLWGLFGLDERIEYLKEAGASIFAARAKDAYSLYERDSEFYYKVQSWATE